MKFNPAALSATALVAALKPEIGADSIVKISPHDLILLGTIEMTGAATGAFTANPTAVYPAAAPIDIFCRIDNPASFTSTGIEIELTVTFSDDTTDTATATFDLPQTSGTSILKLPIGLATDAVLGTPSNESLAVKSIALSSVANGAVGNRITVWGSPRDMEEYGLGCGRSKSGAYALPQTVNIPCGRNPQQYTKSGRGEVQNLNVQYVYVDELSGLNRLNGHRATVMIETVKDDVALSQRTVYTGYLPSASPERGDGNDEVIATSEGPYENFFVFLAR